MLPTVRHTSLSGGESLREILWEGSEPAWLFIHHNRGSAGVWERFAESLTTKRRMLAFDLPGCGESSPLRTGDYSARCLAEIAAEVLGRNGLESVHVVGAALGGNVALLLAALHPELVRSVVMLDSGYPLDADFVATLVRGIQSSPDVFANEAAARAYARSMPSAAGYAWSGHWRQYFHQTFRDLGDGRWVFRANREAVVRTTEHLMDDLGGEIQRVACPVLILRGGNSEVFSGQAAEELMRHLRDGRLRTVAAAHHLMLLEDDLRPIAEEIERFHVALGL